MKTKRTKTRHLYAEDTDRTILAVALTMDHHRAPVAHGPCRGLRKSYKNQPINLKDDQHAEKVFRARLAKLERYAGKIGLWLDHNIKAFGVKHKELNAEHEEEQEGFEHDQL